MSTIRNPCGKWDSPFRVLQRSELHPTRVNERIPLAQYEPHRSKNANPEHKKKQAKARTIIPEQRER
jgi:hypothetical protein